MKEAGVDEAKLKPHPTAVGMDYLSHRRIGNVNRLRDYLYQEATVWLDRKRVKFSEVPVKYYSSRRVEIVKTLRERARILGVEEFDTHVVAKWFGIDYDQAWWAVSKAVKEGVIYRVRAEGYHHFYRFHEST